MKKKTAGTRFEKKDWFKTCRPHLEWVTWEKNPDVEKYADELIDRAKKINSDTIVYPWESGGYLLYPGKLAPMYENINGQDLLGTIERKAHENGLKFVVCFLGISGNSYLTKTRPDWVQQDDKGELIAQWDGYNFRSMCQNSPYSDYLYEAACDILKRYRVDGLYLEGVYVAPGFCHCPNCKKYFKKKYGREIPTENLSSDVEYNEFRQRSMNLPFELMGKAIDKTSPSTVFFGCIGASYFYNQQGYDARTIGKYADVVCIEGQWNYDLPAGYDPGFALTLQEMGLVQRIMRAESQKPVLGTIWIAKHVDQNYSPRSKANVILNYQQLQFQNSLVQTHTQDALEIDETHLSTLSRLYKDTEKLADYLKDSKVAANVALAHWSKSTNLDNFFNKHFKGAYKALLENHIPCELVTPEQILDSIENFDVLFLPNALEISKQVTNKIVEYVQNGGGLVMTYQTVKNNSALAKLAGIKKVGEAVHRDGKFPLHTYYRINSKEKIWKAFNGTLLSFLGPYQQVEASGNAEVIGSITDFDQSRRSDKHIIQVCYPGANIGPMVIANKYGKGKVVYIAAALDAAAKNYGDPNSIDVLCAAVKYISAKDFYLKTNCPPSVEIITHKNKDKMAILLLNETTNQYISDPIRYVVTLADIEVQFKLGQRKPKKVYSLTGRKLKSEVKNGWLKVNFDKLDEYEAILVNF